MQMNLKAFRSYAPGCWPHVDATQWNDWKWQSKNRITTLAQLEALMELTPEERAGTILSGSKLALGITPYFFNLIDREDPLCPIRRQVIPRLEETLISPSEMADPCGEDSRMPVPGLVHRYPDRVLFLVTDRCASYCRYCTRSRVVSGAGEQELHIDFEQAFRYLETHTEVRDVLRSCFPTTAWKRSCGGSGPSSILNSSGSAHAFPSFCRNASRRSFARCSSASIRSG